MQNMSCQLILRAGFQDIKAVKKYLLPTINEEALLDKGQGQDELEGWDDSDWGWKNEDDDETDDVDSATKAGNSSWLQECMVAMSPVGDLMAIARGDRIVLLTQKWDVQDSDVQTTYAITCESRLFQDEGEKITAVLCLPLASQKRSMQGGADWTCVIVGFSSGYVRMYTESGAVLLSQIFSDEVVLGIKCRTYQPARHCGDVEKHEELNILYKKSLVTIDGFSFFQSLRACRNQVARAAASGSEQIPPPPLAYKKWSLHDQDEVVQHIACGLVTPNPFDQMKTASMLGGYNASIRSNMPASYLYITTGRAPYLNFFYAVEGSTQPMLSDVAHAVATKLKSALYSAASGWLSFGSRQNQDPSREKRRPKIEPPTSLPARYGLHDVRRHGETVSLSPDSRLAASTDSFGRVMLIDVHHGIAIRMWKGYRDAQVGWVEVEEERCLEHTSQSVLRHSLFLVIYAPRRGILEVWTAQQGPRVAAFNVTKWCQMVCVQHGIMALNNVTFRDVNVQRYQVYLLDPDGSIRTIAIPFHLALSDKNSKRARDLHLLKKLKILLKDNMDETDNLQADVVTTLLEIRIASVRQQALQQVISTPYLSAEFLKAVVAAVMAPLTNPEESCQGGCDYESRLLSQFCQSQLTLLDTFTSLRSILSAGSPAPDVDDQELSRVLLLSLEELAELREQLVSYGRVQEACDPRRVSFASDLDLGVVAFLGCFHCEPLRDAGLQLQLHRQLAQPLQLANFLFRSCLENGVSSEYTALLSRSQLLAEELVALLMQLWLSHQKPSLQQTIHLRSLIKAISCLKDEQEVVSENSPWWLKLRTTCSEADNISAALMAALVGRSVALEMAQMGLGNSMSSPADDTPLDMSDWESVSMDRANWTLLVKQLEDLLALSCLLAMRPSPPVTPTTPGSESLCSDVIEVSVKKVLEGGRGVLSELVAKWIAGHRIPVSRLCLTERSSTQQTSADEMRADTDSKLLNPLVAQLQSVQNRLPHSLDSDVLLANAAWEYMVLWNKDPEVIFQFEQAIAYLRCLQNAMLQHGVAAMMWQMFVNKKLSAAAFLMEKVGKAPKDRLCRKDVGLGEEAMRQFISLAAQLLATLIQAQEDTQEVPVLHTEDVWQAVSGPTSLLELAVEQKQVNAGLARHHLHLCTILHAILTLAMRGVKPLSLLDTKGRSALFKPLQSSPSLSADAVDETLIAARQQFMRRVITESVVKLNEGDDPADMSPSSGGHVKVVPNKWPGAMLHVGRYLQVDVDGLRRHYVSELYSSSCDRLAEEVLLTVSESTRMGSDLLLTAGCRLAHFIFVCDPPGSVSKLARCSPAISTWLKSLSPHDLRHPNATLSDTAALVGHVIHLLPEPHAQRNQALELLDLTNNLM